MICMEEIEGKGLKISLINFQKVFFSNEHEKMDEGVLSDEVPV